MIITDKTQEVLKRAAFRHIMQRGIRTDEELYFVVKDVLGVSIPTEVCCDNHQPMWEALADDFFHRVPKQAIRHCRGGGKTNTVATTKAVKLLNYGGLRISNFAASENQGYALYNYVERLLGPNADPEVRRLVKKVEGSRAETMPKPVPGRPKPEGSIIRVIVGTLKGVNSEHVDDLVQDERAQMDDKVAKESIGMMTSRDPYPGILTVLSTVKAKGDGMDVLLSDAEERGYKTYVSCLLDVTTCKEKNCDGCKNTWSYSADRQRRKNFFDYCQGRILGKSLGHFSVSTARNKFVEMGLENSESQLFCLSPEGEETAFPQFSYSNNVQDLSHKVSSDSRFYVFGDFGKSDLSTFIKAYDLLHDPIDPCIYFSDELIDKQKTIQEWIPILQKAEYDKALAFLVDVAGRQTTIVSKKSAIDHMEDQGWTVISQKMDEVETTERLRTLVGVRRVRIHPRCKRTIEAFEKAKNEKKGQGDDAIYLRVVKHNKYSHPIDASRYGTFILCPDDNAPAPSRYRFGRGRRR